MVFGICSLIFRLGCYVFCFDLGSRFDRGLGSDYGIVFDLGKVLGFHYKF